MNDVHQFGFNRRHSTGACTFVLKVLLTIMLKKGSHAFCCFVDFTKAFDYVDYWLLFSKLFESSSVVKLRQCTRLLAY